MAGNIPVAWLQLSKEKLRLLVALSGVSFAVILVFMQLGFRASVDESATRYQRGLDYDENGLGARQGDPQQVAELAETDDERRCRREADDHGPRKEVDDEPQAQHGHPHLNSPYEERQQNRQLDVARRPRLGQLAEPHGHNDHVDGDDADGEVSRRADERVDQQGDE